MIRKIQNYLINTKIWVSIMITSLSVFFSFLNQNINYKRTVILFFSTLAAYNFICFYDKWKTKGINQNSFYIFSLSFFITSILLLLQIKDISLIINIFILATIVLMYNSKILHINLRNIPLLKIFIISFVWTYAILYVGNAYTLSFPLFFSLFFFVLGITIPFDIHDMKEDSITTLPKWIGVNKSKYIAYLSLASSLLFFSISFPKLVYKNYIIYWGFTCIVSIFLILLMKKNSLPTYTRFWIEATSSIPILLIILK